MKNRNRQKQKKSIKIWSLSDAIRTVPYIRSLCGTLRESLITAKHYYRKGGYDKGTKYDAEIAAAQNSGRATINEFTKLCVIPYQNPIRGIALFPFLVYYQDDKGNTPREAFYVYKDSRNRIDSFIYADEEAAYNDLYGWELPIPEEWRREGVSPSITTSA